MLNDYIDARAVVAALLYALVEFAGVLRRYVVRTGYNRETVEGALVICWE